ncbi:MAG: hypothetical protein ACTHJ0_08400 [Flavipsychrobacter sp.]
MSASSIAGILNSVIKNFVSFSQTEKQQHLQDTIVIQAKTNKHIHNHIDEHMLQLEFFYRN